MGAIGFDFLSGGRVDASAGVKAFGERFGEIQFPGGEEVTEQADILRRVMESLGDDAGWEAVNKRGPQGLIASLPIGNGMSKKGSIFHDAYYVV